MYIVYKENIQEIWSRARFHVKVVHGLAFGIPKFYIAPYDKINHRLVNLSSNCDVKSGLRADFTSNLLHELAFGTSKFCIVPYGKIKHRLVNLSSNCDVKSGLSPDFTSQLQLRLRSLWFILS